MGEAAGRKTAMTLTMSMKTATGSRDGNLPPPLPPPLPRAKTSKCTSTCSSSSVSSSCSSSSVLSSTSSSNALLASASVAPVPCDNYSFSTTKSNDQPNGTPTASATAQANGAPGKVSPLSMAEVMDELQSRFLVNLPESELNSTERLFFQIEQCYWFYEDFYADQLAHLQHLKLNDFAKMLFAHCPLLQPLAHRCEELFADFKTYQSQVPVVGCILLNGRMDKLVLVRNWKGTSWSFPRGKVNQGESDLECARREVFEECGYDVGDTLSERLYIEFVQNQQKIRMYLSKGVPEDYNFAPQTRKEISLIQWFTLDTLPKKTWCVLPFMPRLKRWINRNKTPSRGKGANKNNLNGTGGNGNQSKGRAASAPRNRPAAIVTVASSTGGNTMDNKKKASERSVSTPHARPVARKNRGHFGTEFETPTSYDGVNHQTFGTNSTDFSVEEMFSVNEKLTGQKFVYDGNPHDFGKPNTTLAVTSPTDVGVTAALPELISPRVKKLDEQSQSSTSTDSSSSSTAPEQQQQPFKAFKFDAVDIMACVT